MAGLRETGDQRANQRPMRLQEASKASGRRHRHRGGAASSEKLARMCRKFAARAPDPSSFSLGYPESRAGIGRLRHGSCRQSRLRVSRMEGRDPGRWQFAGCLHFSFTMPACTKSMFRDLRRRHSTVPDESFRVAQDIRNRSAVPASQGTFPDHERAPSVRFQRGQRVAVPVHVAIDLGLPERGAGLGPSEQRASMTVPEASMYEDRGAVLRKHHVGFSGHVRCMESVAETAPVKTAPHEQLGSGVPAPDPAHY